MLPIVALLLVAADDAPIFVARTMDGKNRRGPLTSLSPDGARLGGHKVTANELFRLRQDRAKLPPCPEADHLVLVGGARVPFRQLRMEEDHLKFRHPDLGTADVSVPLSIVNAVWRAAPSRELRPDAACRRFISAKRSGDVMVLRNGDTITGTLASLGDKVVFEAGKSKRTANWDQVSAIGLNSSLLSKEKPGDKHWRIVVAASRTSPGGRFTVIQPEVKDEKLQAKTTFGATLTVPVERVLSLQPEGTKAVPLSSLVPTKYDYFPYLDEKAKWSADATEAGTDLRVGGSTWGRGVSLRAHSRIEYAVTGHARFEALVGLDDQEGKRGKAKCVILVDGKAKAEHELEWGKAAALIQVPLDGAKSLAIEVRHAGSGPVRAVVDVVDAWLFREAKR
jgi:hypothetical protein